MADDTELNTAIWQLVDVVRRRPAELWPNAVEQFLASLTGQLDEHELAELLKIVETRCRDRRTFGKWSFRPR